MTGFMQAAVVRMEGLRASSSCVINPYTAMGDYSRPKLIKRSLLLPSKFLNSLLFCGVFLFALYIT